MCKLKSGYRSDMGLLAIKISKTRVFISVSLILLLVFTAWPFLPFPEEYARDALNVLGTAYLSAYLAIWGMIGLYLYYRGEPLRDISTNLLLAPLIFLLFFAAGGRWLRFIPFLGYVPVVFVISVLSLKRAKQIGLS